MSILVIIAIVVGTLVFAWLFDKFFGLIFKEKISPSSPWYMVKLSKDYTKELERRRRRDRWHAIIKALMIWK